MRRRAMVTRRGAVASAGAGLALALGACAAASFDVESEAAAGASGDEAAAGTAVTDSASDSDPAPADPDAAVDRLLSSLTLEQRVAQLFVVRPEDITGVGVATAAGETTRRALLEMPVGGLVYFSANLVDADQTREMLAATARYGEEACGLAPLLCVDEEGGTVSRVGGNPGFDVDNVGDMCDVGATGDADYAREVAAHVGSYLANLGFTVDFAPVADVANNPGSDTMHRRSFGSDASVVAEMVRAQVEGFAQAGVLCSAKHFPGIGGAMGDSHDSRIYSQKTVDEMRDVELLPFRAAVEADVPLVMVGHLSLPSVTGDDRPASVSREVVTGILREELGYDGVVVTDSMAMGAATDSLPAGRLGVEPLLAGADLVLMPADLQAAYQGVLDAVEAGELTEERIDVSFRRVARAKLTRL